MTLGIHIDAPLKRKNQKINPPAIPPG